MCQAIIVCLISALIKKRYKVGKRLQTAIEVAFSFIVAGAVALVFKDGNYSDVITRGLETAGVALAVCGFICGEGKATEMSEDTVDVILNLQSGSKEDIKNAVLSSPDVKLNDKEEENPEEKSTE